LQKVSVRDAFYEGSARIIPVIIVSFWLLILFIPAVLGSGLLGFALQASASSLESIVAISSSLLLILVSFWLFAVYWPAFYIVTLPNMYPLKSLRSAANLTKKHRLSILRKFVLLGIFSFLFVTLFVLPVALVLPIIVPYYLYIVIFALFMISQVYLFELYRGLM
jgi:hypothetical protein